MSLVGTRIAHFLVEEQIGMGGMGAVYAAVDERLKRRVALKALRRDRVGTEARARFLREARILSQLDHPNICRVYEYIPGVDADYLALELVGGRSLRDLVASGEQAALRPSARLAIAEQLATALAAAHAKGIVHRDLKPENVMLTPTGGPDAYRVRVLDFGLAHSSEEPAAHPLSPEVEHRFTPRLEVDSDGDTLTFAARRGLGPVAPEASPPELPSASPLAIGSADTEIWHSSYVQTEHGSLIGTLAYMSPEQARGEAATPASDVYALGLLLQELFTGQRAYPADTPFLKLRERVAEGERVPLPASFDGGLAALLGRILGAEPTGRPSAAEVASRLAWLRGRTRRRVTWALAAATLLLALGGLGKYAWDLRRERNRALTAQAAEASSRREAEAVARFLVDLFEVSDPGKTRGETVTARELLDRGAARLPFELADQPLVRSRLMATIGLVYCRIGLYDRGVSLAESALASRRESGVDDELEVARWEAALASCYYDQGRYADAERLGSHVVAVREQRLGRDHPDVAQALNDRGLVYWHLDRFAEARADQQRALAIWERTRGGGSTEVSGALNNLAQIAKSSGHPEEAETLLRRSLAIREKTLRPDDPLLATTYNNLGEIELILGRHAAAEPYLDRALAIWQRAFGPTHPKVATALNNLATLYDDTSRSAEAEVMYRRVLTIYRETFGPQHYGVGIALNNLADVCARQRRDAESEASYRQSIAVFEQALGPTDALVAHPVLGLAQLLARVAATGDFGGRSSAVVREEALSLGRRALAIREQALGAEHPDTVATRKVLAEL